METQAPIGGKIKIMSTRGVGQCVVLFAVPLVLPGQGAQPQLKELVGISAEHGFFALDGDTLSAFSDRDIWLEDPTSPHHNRDLVRTQPPEGKRFGVFTVRVRDLQWHQIDSPLPLSEARDFALCDPLDQIDIRSTDDRGQSVLPTGVKIKKVVEVKEDLTLVVYSTPSDTSTLGYAVRVGLVGKRKSGMYSLLQDELATDPAKFCGVQSGRANLFFVFADESAASSNYRAVYIYAVVAR